MDYISREEAIKNLREVYEHEYPTASGDFDEYASHDVPNVLRNMKAADVQPIRHGRWVCNEELYFNGMTKCSCCNEEYYIEDIQNLQGDLRTVNYCPNCGADMRGDTD